MNKREIKAKLKELRESYRISIFMNLFILLAYLKLKIPLLLYALGLSTSLLIQDIRDLFDLKKEQEKKDGNI